MDHKSPKANPANMAEVCTARF